jgi:hypothetical protein
LPVALIEFLSGGAFEFLGAIGTWQRQAVVAAIQAVPHR